MAQIKKKGILAWARRHEEGGEREFSRKKISEGMGKEARDFSEKIFFGNFKILRDLSCASRRLPLGGTPPPPPQKRKFATNKAIQTAQTVQTVQIYARNK